MTDLRITRQEKGLYGSEEAAIVRHLTTALMHIEDARTLVLSSLEECHASDDMSRGLTKPPEWAKEGHSSPATTRMESAFERLYDLEKLTRETGSALALAFLQEQMQRRQSVDSLPPVPVE